ncbi:MAG: hypothetical protein M1324_03705 [Patescibacteria group bacterium]|nr:hypothetical protein [Patescibacteria group bacterium]
MARLFKVLLGLMLLAVFALPAIAGPPPLILAATISATSTAITPVPAMQVVPTASPPVIMAVEVKATSPRGSSAKEVQGW